MNKFLKSAKKWAKRGHEVDAAYRKAHQEEFDKIFRISKHPAPLCAIFRTLEDKKNFRKMCKRMAQRKASPITP